MISVGAVYDASFGTANFCISAASCAPRIANFGCPTGFSAADATAADRVTSYSNTAPFLGLFAPANQCFTLDISGTAGYSVDDYTTSFGGTSAACPYTAGAVAALQSAAKALTGSFLSPADIRIRLQSTGDPLTDTKVPITQARVNLGHAIDTLPTGGQAFRIHNDGPGTLTVNSIAPRTSSPWLSVVPTGPFDIMPGSYVTVHVDVNFSVAPSGESTVRLLVASTDPDENPYPEGIFVVVRRTLTQVTVAATDATAGEPNSSQDTGTFTFSRTGSTAAALTVNYAVGGTATSGTDFNSLGTAVSFAAGSATKTKLLNVLDDAAVEGNESVVLTLAGGSGYTVGSAASATVMIHDDDQAAAVVTVAATDATAGEPDSGQGTGTFTFSRTGSTAAALTVNFRVAGTAGSETDYNSIGTDVRFAAGAATATKTVRVINDEALEEAESVTVRLTSGSGYTIGSPSLASVMIQDDDAAAAVVTVAATDATAGEPNSGQGTGTFTFSRTGSMAAALTVNFRVAGTAGSETDYNSIGTDVRFAAGAATATKTVRAIDDEALEEAESVTVRLTSGSGYTIGSSSLATVMIQDDDAAAAVVTVTATDATAGEPDSSQGTGTFTFSRTGSTAAALTVNFRVAGTASSETDYNSIGTDLRFAAGVATATKTVRVINDEALEEAETVTVRLTNGGGYTIGSSSSATVRIQDDDVSPVTTLGLRNRVNVVIKGGAFGDQGIALQFAGVVAKRCVIESSPDLMSWSPVSTNATHDQVIDLYDPNMGRASQQFYRLVPVTDRSDGHSLHRLLDQKCPAFGSGEEVH
ncbi:MAG: hypothetical protein L0Z50_14330 [Verrucomicrobiales bacterium]|nr:hypothetical protein [Verrucomicrobiales bacterium]